MNLYLECTNLLSYLEGLDCFERALREAISDGLEESADYTVRKLKEKTYAKGAIGATKAYLNGFRWQPAANASALVQGIEITNDSRHAKYVEEGREPGAFPHKESIEAWMTAKGIDLKFSFLIRRAIARKGTIKRAGYGGLEIMRESFEEEEAMFILSLDSVYEKIVGTLHEVR